MTSSLLLPYLVLMATLMRALAVKAKIASPTCGRCALPLERRELGEPVCRCSR
jgi:hypothetical protein